MALDTELLNAQVTSIKRQSAAASHLIRVLTTYKNTLSGAWSGKEARPVIKALEDQLRDCKQLRDELDTLGRDLLQTAGEVQQQAGLPPALPQEGGV